MTILLLKFADNPKRILIWLCLLSNLTQQIEFHCLSNSVYWANRLILVLRMSKLYLPYRKGYTGLTLHFDEINYCKWKLLFFQCPYFLSW